MQSKRWESNPLSGQESDEAGKRESLTAEQEAQAAYWLEITEKELREAAKNKPAQAEIERAAAEVEALLAEWLTPEKLEPLQAIETAAEAAASPERQTAKQALTEILSRIKILETTLPAAEIDQLMKRHRILSRAVGVINSGRVDHSR